MSHSTKLWTLSFISACIGNFMLFFAFYLLVPIFPLYLIDEFAATKSMVGLILSSYTVAALLIRPFAGFVLDLFYRRPIYLIAYSFFILSFLGYPIVHSVGMFLFFRIIHGFTFGFVTTAGNSLMVDILPASRLGEGLGYFGVANNMAMAVGPMVALMLHEKVSYNVIFYTAVITGFIGFIFASSIKARNMSTRKQKLPLTIDRFILFKGMNASLCLLLMGVPYGMLVIFVAVYGKEVGILKGVGFFFTLMAVGLTFSRLIGGRFVDKGKLIQVILWGTALCVLAFICLPTLKWIDNQFVVLVVFYLIALMIGLGYGLIFPAYNTLFVNLAPINRRGTASSTYMTGWDMGIGLGVTAGGWIADGQGGLSLAYAMGAGIAFFSFLYFAYVAGPHFLKHKLR